MKALLQSLLPRPKKKASSNDPNGNRRHSRPCLEMLEVREVLSTFGVQVFDDGVLVPGTTMNAGNQLLFMGTSADFNMNMVLGYSNSPGTAGGAMIQMSPNSMMKETTTGTHTLTVELTSTDFTIPSGLLVLSASAGGEYVGGGSVKASYQAYLDPSNTAFGQPAGDGTPLLTAAASGPMNSLVFTTPTNPSNPGTATALVNQPNASYSITAIASFTINAAGGDVVNLGTTVTAAPSSSMATPSISTTPNSTSVTLGDTTPPVLTDTADLTGGNSPSGTITFKLYGPTGTLLDTETANVNGNGDYTTPTGYTLPSSPTVGTYQWDASYSGDSGNAPVSESGNTNEQVIVSPAAPAIVTTPSVVPGSSGIVPAFQPPGVTTTLGTTSETLQDAAQLSGGYNPTGTITFNLYYNGGSNPVDTETVQVSGNGVYATPIGYTLPMSGTPVTGTYQWDATYSGDSDNKAANDTGNANEQVGVNPATPSIVTSPGATNVTLGANAVTITDTAVLSGGYAPSGTITFNLYAPNGTLVDTETATVNGNGNYATPNGYTLPTNAATGTYQWDATYSGDSNNVAFSESNNANEQVVVSPAIPSITTTPNVTSVALSNGPATLTDTATLSGAYAPTGTITFTLYLNGSLLDTETVAVNGDGNYTTPNGYTLQPTAATGTYQWDAAYSGDSNNNTISDNNNPNEQVVVSSGNPIVIGAVRRLGPTVGTTTTSAGNNSLLASDLTSSSSSTNSSTDVFQSIYLSS